MNFSTPEKVLETIRSGDDAELKRGRNRVLINRAANNEPLLDEDEAKRVGMEINIRWGEFMGALSHARRQYITNFCSQDNYFTVSVPKAPEEVRSDWGDFITEFINDVMKEGEHELEYFEVHRSKWSGVVSHGIGPIMWEDTYNWLPRYVAIEDLRVPTDTELSFRNLTWFAVRIPYTPGELSRKAFSKVKSKFKWNKKAVSAILENVKECNTTMAENNYDWNTVPEKFEELRKQNAGYWSGDAMPTINLWHFYHEDDDGSWHLKVVPENNTSGVTAEADDKFICEHEGAIAPSWRHILHVQFGDLNNKAPFLYHSVRSLGFALFEPCYWTDFTRNRLLKHILDQFNILLRIADPVDRARAQIQVFQNLGVIKPGVSIVPAAERHQIDSGLAEMALAMGKQLQQEASTAYTQNIDTGTKKEQTAFETGVKVQQTNAMLSGLMLVARIYEKSAAKEICRRFCLKKSDDEDVMAFQKACKKQGIAEEWIDVKKWRVEITQPLGGGNPTMAMVEAENAMKLRPMLDPSAQAEALHDAAVQMVGSRRAKRWVQASKKVISDASAAAAANFPLMMLGMPPSIPEGLNPIEQIQKLLELATRYIVKIESTTKMATPMELIGLQNVSAFIGKLIQGMQGDVGNEPKMKEFAKALSQVNNEIKKLQQHLQMEVQKKQQQNGNGELQQQMAETKVKLAGKQAETQQKLKSKELADIQKRRHKDTSFVADQKRQNAKAVAEILRGGLKNSRSAYAKLSNGSDK
jgi:hypothetical protein